MFSKSPNTGHFSYLNLAFITCARRLLQASLIYLCYSSTTFAEENIVELTVKPNIVATASYTAGVKQKSAILIIHGFLTTREHATLKNLNLAIADEGYTTLVPTLSLDIDRRKQSLACEAIHTHTMQTDINEIDMWIKWLQQKGHKKIILLGHSFGSLNMLVYLANKNPDIQYAIATSLIDIEHAIGTQSVNKQLAEARQAVKSSDQTLHEYKISYCKKFVSTASSFISYAEWNKQKILNLLNNIRTPVQIVMGSNDQRMDKNWPAMLKKKGLKVSIIQGANHFFSNEYEFELHDKILEIINSI